MPVVRWCSDADFFASFLRPVLYFQRAACSTFSDLHPKFALRPYHVSKYGIDIQSAAAEIRRGKKIEEINHKVKI